MKLKYFLIVIFIWSCKQHKTSENTTNTSNGAIEIIDDAVEAAAGAVEIPQEIVTDQQINTIVFEQIMKAAKIQTLPYRDSTNFQNFKPEKLLNKEEVAALQLTKIFPDFYKKALFYQAAVRYKLELNDAFQALVVTVLQGNEVISTALLVYASKDKTLIDFQEIAFTMKGYEDYKEAKFDNRFEFKTNHHSYKHEQIQILSEYVINYETGMIEAQESKLPALMTSVLENEIQINRLEIDEERITTKTFYDDPEKIIIVVPEIVEEGEMYFELNSHMLLVDVESKTITASLTETPKDNGWVSDAIRLSDISIQSTFYGIIDNTHAFALCTQFVGMSRVNPYESKKVSLYVKSGDTFKKVLNNFEIYKYGGEWDGNCKGFFIIHDKTLTMSNEKTNGYYDILVKNIITEDKNILDENGECQSIESHSAIESRLVFNGVEYVEL